MMCALCLGEGESEDTVIVHLNPNHTSTICLSCSEAVEGALRAARERRQAERRIHWVAEGANVPFYNREGQYLGHRIDSGMVSLTRDAPQLTQGQIVYYANRTVMGVYGDGRIVPVGHITEGQSYQPIGSGEIAGMVAPTPRWGPSPLQDLFRSPIPLNEWGETWTSSGALDVAADEATRRMNQLSQNPPQEHTKPGPRKIVWDLTPKEKE